MLAESLKAMEEILALEQLHDEEGLAHGRDSEVEDLDDVRMAQAARELGLAKEAPQRLGIRHPFLGQHLDRDLAVERQLGRLVDDAHTTLADHALDAIT